MVGMSIMYLPQNATKVDNMHIMTIVIPSWQDLQNMGYYQELCGYPKYFCSPRVNADVCN